jgi:GTP-binding protein
MSLFQQIQYLASAAELHQLPPDDGAEVAFAGRSNAGKSSAINAICGRRKLAFVSRTPGRTQMINFFSLGPSHSLVDLPGYGYARVPAEIRSRWEKLLGTYLARRAALRGLVVVVDARHALTPLDRQMLEWFGDTGKPVHVLITKADKLSRQQQLRQRDAVQRALAQLLPRATAQLFSSVTGDGVEQARRWLLECLNGYDEAVGASAVESATAEKENPRPKG